MTRFWKFFIVFGKGLGSFECMFDGKCLPQKNPKDASWGRWKSYVFRVQWCVSILKPNYNPIDIPVPVTSLRTICLSISSCSSAPKNLRVFALIEVVLVLYLS